MYGWTGRRAVVDLSNSRTDVQDIDQDLLYKYLGGRGLNVKTLFDMVQPGCDPYAPENPVIFGTGPVTGTLVPTNSRYNITSRSPLTVLGDANPAGFWAAELKYAGFDQVVITGQAEKPVFIYIYNGRVEIRDAGHLWGKTVWEADQLIKEELGEDVQVSAIGPAGENLVRYACVINNLKRAAGRTGMGAVLGAKKVKAVAVRGTGQVNTAHPEEHLQVVREMLEQIYAAPAYPVRSKYGTTVVTDIYIRQGTLPVRNAQAAVFEEADRVTARAVEKYTQNLKGCFACPIHCSRFTRVKEGEYAGAASEGPEFETLVALGPRCGNGNLESILMINQLVNELGLDSISAGGSISFIMECYQKGLVTKEQFDGLDLSWGNHRTIIELLKKIARREGCGDFLAEGVMRMAKKIPGSEDFAIHVKGQEPAEQEPRGLKAWGLGWAVSSRGADHLRAFPLAETTWTKEDAIKAFGTDKVTDRFAYEGKPELVKWSEEVSAVVDSLEICKFSQMVMALPLSLTAKVLWTVTGWEIDEKELLTIGERIVNLERMFIVREGLGRKDDRLPKRYSEPIREGASQGQTCDVEKMLDRYYELRGWDTATGHPTPGKLAELGL